VTIPSPPVGDDGKVEAVADIALWESDRSFSLPADGTPSMLFRFGGPEGVTVGVRATDPSGVPFAPDTNHEEVHLVFWAKEAKDLVAVGAPFDVWYIADIGSGRITAVA
jgi:hypothetical protein